MKIEPETARAHLSLLRHVAHADMELLRRLQSGEMVPPGLDIDTLCERVEMWTRHQLLEWVEEGNPWWVPDLFEMVAAAWRRKHTAAIMQGNWLSAGSAAGGALIACGAVSLLGLRCAIRCGSASALRPVLRYTAT